MTLIPADMDSQVESLGEEEEKVRTERKRGWEGVRREGNGALIGYIGSKSLVNMLVS